MHEHPYFDYFRRTRDGTAHTMEDFLSHRQWHRLALYNEVFRPLGLDDGMGLVVEADWPMVVGLGACRAGWGFSSQERMLLNLLRPHVAQAWSNVRAFAQLRREMQAMSAALEALGCRLLELDHTGRARFLSREARALLARYFGNKAGLAQGHLPEKLRYWARQVQTREPGTNLLPQRAPLVLESEHGRLIVRLIAGSDGSRLLLKEEPKSVPATALRRLGLTERECEVLAWIAEGKTNAEIAAILGLSPLTVKRHVEDILAKLKAPNRSAAVAIASAP
jgi:DNA-binding CsgD family transcriptional regulator